jgi:hypothetical protein
LVTSSRELSVFGKQGKYNYKFKIPKLVEDTFISLDAIFDHTFVLFWVACKNFAMKISTWSSGSSDRRHLQPCACTASFLSGQSGMQATGGVGPSHLHH